MSVMDANNDAVIMMRGDGNDDVVRFLNPLASSGSGNLPIDL